MTADEIESLWKSKWYRKELEQAITDFVRRPTGLEHRYVAAILIDPEKEGLRWSQKFREISTAFTGHNLPHHSGIILLKDEGQVETLRTILGEEVKVWNFLTAEAL